MGWYAQDRDREETMKKRKHRCRLWFMCLLCLLGGVFARFSFDSEQTALHTEAGLCVHFIDVGQADCTLVQLPNGENMLIDAGNNENGEEVVSYLKRQKVSRIDYLIGTHPHADHIGGLDNVISAFDIGAFYMPKVQTNTKTFREVLEAAQKKGLKIKSAKAGLTLAQTEKFQIEMLAPNSDSYEDLNNYSAVIRLTCGERAFLITGDAEQLAEEEIGSELRSDVLKVGHHGSKTSTSEEFLRRVSPQYAYISCGEDNSYGHPHTETLEKLERAEVTVYRADKDGTVIFCTDGKNLEVEK